jgi:hypothetical protein
MIKEFVDISVADGQSTVKGRYTFRLGHDDWPEVKDTHVSIYIPVLSPPSPKTTEAPEVRVNGRRIKPFHRPPVDDLPPADVPQLESRGLPHGWSIDLSEYRIPLRDIGPEFSLEASYPQPHLPGNIAAYLPVRPPKDPEQAHIVFHTAAGYQLKPFSKRFFYQPSYATLDFFPKDGEIIRVKCVPNR